MTLAKVGQKVKITNCSYDNVWYRDYIGQEFTVEKVIERKGVNSSKGYYILADHDFCGVEEIDCVLIKEEQLDSFKSGDKVITTDQGGWYEAGVVLTLTKPYKDYGWYTLEKGEGFFVDTVKIKHYKQPPKNMLQNGMRVKFRSGEMFTLIDGAFVHPKLENSSRLEYIYVSELMDDLTYKYNNTWDVVEIYAAPKYVFNYFNYNVATFSIWTRKEKSAKQLQLEALQKQAQEVADAIKKLQDEE